MKLAVYPLDDNIIVKSKKKDTISKGGVILPDIGHSVEPVEAIVVAVGPGRYLESGLYIEMDLKVDDKVIISPYGGQEIVRDDIKYIIISRRDILALLKEA